MEGNRMNSFAFFVFIFFAAFVYSSLKPDHLNNIIQLLDEIQGQVKDTAVENKALYKFLKDRENLKTLLLEKDLTTVITAVNELLCLKGEGCMAVFNSSKLSIDPSIGGSLDYEIFFSLEHHLRGLHAEGDSIKRLYNILAPGMVWKYIWEISQVLKYYSSLLKIATPETELFKKLNVRFQFDELIPRLSAACLKLKRNEFPQEFYDKLEKAVIKKEFEEKKDGGKTQDKNNSNAGDQEGGNQSGNGQNDANKSPLPLGMKIFLALIVAAIGLIIYFVKRKR
jgi:hypothetical protein